MTATTRASVDRVLTSAGFDAVAGVPERWARRRRHLLPVLTYHRVLPEEQAAEAAPGTVSATPERFEEQMRFLARHRRPIGAAELLRARLGEQRLPAGAVLVTFDDGYADFADHAWPVLRRLDIPVILFVPTGFASGDLAWFWWDRLWRAVAETDQPVTPPDPVGPLPLGSLALARSAYRTLREHLKALPHEQLEDQVAHLVARLGEPRARPGLLGWDKLRALRDEGVDIGSHTVSHPLLTRVDGARRTHELEASLATLRAELHWVLPALAYPSGDCDAEVARDAAAAGYEVAFSTQRGVNDVRVADWHRLERINVGSRTSKGLLRAQLSPRLAGLARSRA